MPLSPTNDPRHLRLALINCFVPSDPRTSRPTLSRLNKTFPAQSQNNSQLASKCGGGLEWKDREWGNNTTVSTSTINKPLRKHVSTLAFPNAGSSQAPYH